MMSMLSRNVGGQVAQSPNAVAFQFELAASPALLLGAGMGCLYHQMEIVKTQR
jgi:hypothetical protein